MKDQSKSANPAPKTEFDDVAVPLSARKSTLSLLMISFGYVFVATTMEIGGNIFGPCTSGRPCW